MIRTLLFLISLLSVSIASAQLPLPLEWIKGVDEDSICGYNYVNCVDVSLEEYNLEVLGIKDIEYGVLSRLVDLDMTFTEDVYGNPGYYDIHQCMIRKIKKDKSRTIEEVKASYILVENRNRDQDTLQAYLKAKALYDKIKNSGSIADTFKLLEYRPNIDTSTIGKAMDLGWFERGRMVPSFEKACFEGHKGDLILVNTEYGYTIAYITENPISKPDTVARYITRIYYHDVRSSSEEEPTYGLNWNLVRNRSFYLFERLDYAGAIKEYQYAMENSSSTVYDYNYLGYAYILNKQYPAAITILEETRRTYGTNLLVEGNLAHAYLLNGEYKKAKLIYSKYKKQKLENGMTWEQMVQDDFTFFKMNRIECDYYDDVYKLLGIE